MDPEDLDTRTLVLLLAARVRERVLESPVSTLAGAATVGYVLGWSMPTPLYRTLASLGVRALMMQVVTRVFGSSDEGDEADGVELDLEVEEDLDIAGGMKGAARKSDVPPYVA